MGRKGKKNVHKIYFTLLYLLLNNNDNNYTTKNKKINKKYI